MLDPRDGDVLIFSEVDGESKGGRRRIKCQSWSRGFDAFPLNPSARVVITVWALMMMSVCEYVCVCVCGGCVLCVSQ